MQPLQCPEGTELAGIKIRRGETADLAVLVGLEQCCFRPEIQESAGSIRRSLESGHQEVWIADRGGRVAGALFMRKYRRSLKVYSVAVDPQEQGRGVGGMLMRWAVERASELGCTRLLLEVDATKDGLIRWYEEKGYVKQQLLPGYYSESLDAWRMVREL